MKSSETKKFSSLATPALGLAERFGVRSPGQVIRDLREVLRDGLRGRRFQWNVGSAGMLRPDLSLPAYAGFLPRDGLAPIFNFFDRTGGGKRYTQRVSRSTCRDHRGGSLTYDEHDGTDLVCPIGTPLCAAAPGVVVLVRDRWLRGGLTVAVDHGSGIVTQYTHAARALVTIGQPVVRGEPVALSGAAGYDLVQFFPWVPPHVHFMVLSCGTPVDPYLAAGEAAHPGVWLHGNQPAPSAPLSDDPRQITPSDVDPAAIERIAAACTDTTIQAEIAKAAAYRPALAALLEDALCHDAWAFPAEFTAATVRPRARNGKPGNQRPVALTLPLPASDYRGAVARDTPWTRPR